MMSFRGFCAITLSGTAQQFVVAERVGTAGRSHLQLSRAAAEGCECSAEFDAAVKEHHEKRKKAKEKMSALSKDESGTPGHAYAADALPTWCETATGTHPCDANLEVCNGKDDGCREIGIGDGDCDIDADCFGATAKCGRKNCGHFRSAATAKLMSADWDEEDDCCYTTETREPQSLPCRPFCLDTGCPCLVPWSERCDIDSCSGCHQCGGFGGMMNEADWHPDRAPHMLECSGGQYTCPSQSKAQELCKVSGGYTLCDKSVLADHKRLTGTCRYMWTASSEHEGYMIGSGTDGCGRKDILEANNRTWAGRQMFNAACCPIPHSENIPEKQTVKPEVPRWQQAADREQMEKVEKEETKLYR